MNDNVVDTKGHPVGRQSKEKPRVYIQDAGYLITTKLSNDGWKPIVVQNGQLHVFVGWFDPASTRTRDTIYCLKRARQIIHAPKYFSPADLAVPFERKLFEFGTFCDQIVHDVILIAASTPQAAAVWEIARS